MKLKTYQRAALALSVAVALSACGDSKHKPNIPPIVNGSFGAIAERTAVSLTVNASDYDGQIASYQWQQTSGPAVEITGANTANISFTAPSVTADTAITFDVIVTDDDGGSTTFSDTLTVTANTVNYSLSGQIASPLFANAPVTTTIAGQSFSTVADSNGNFTLAIELDEDVTNLFATVTATAPSRSAIEYSAFVRELSPATQAVQSSSKMQRVARASVGENTPNTVTLSEISTALVSLIQSANNGETPADLASFSLIEKEVDPDELLEASALVKYIADNNAELPAGINNVLDLLKDTSAYNGYLETVEASNPGVISNLIDEIVADPELTPAVTSLPAYYIESSPVAPGFLSRGGVQYTFNDDNTGSLIHSRGAENYTWSLADGTVTLNFTGGQGQVSYRSIYKGMEGLTDAEVQKLLDDGYYQIYSVTNYQSGTMTRVVEGESIDSYKVTLNGKVTLGPYYFADGTVISGEYDITDTSNSGMRKPVAGNNGFNQDDMTGSWAIQYYNRDMGDFILDPYVLNADHTGQLQDSGTTFTWEVTDGQLKVTFADGSYQISAIIDQLDDDLQLYNTYYSANDEVEAAELMYAFKMTESATQLPSIQVDEGKFWQTFVNAWDKEDWANGKLTYFSGNDPESQSINLFGWKLTDSNSYRYEQFDGADDNNYTPSGRNITWEQSYANGQNTVTLAYPDYYCNDDFEKICRFRQWQLLKETDGVAGKRLYVKEYEYTLQDDDGWYNSTGHEVPWFNVRLNIYEQIADNYWAPSSSSEPSNVSAVQRAPAQHKAKAAVPRLVLHPTKPLFDSAQ